MILEPEQASLLAALVEDALAVDRSARRWVLIRSFGGDSVHGPGGVRQVLAEDIHGLVGAGLLRRRTSRTDGTMEFTLAPEAFAYAEEVGSLRPVERVEDEIVRRYIVESE